MSFSFLFWLIYVYVVYLCGHVWTYMWRPKVDSDHLALKFSTLLVDSTSGWTGHSPFLPVWPASLLQGHRVSGSPYLPSFYMGPGDLNYHVPTCTARALPTETSPQPGYTYSHLYAKPKWQELLWSCQVCPAWQNHPEPGGWLWRSR